MVLCLFALLGLASLAQTLEHPVQALARTGTYTDSNTLLEHITQIFHMSMIACVFRVCHGWLPCRPRMSSAAETAAVAVAGEVLAMAAGRRLFPLALPAGDPAQGGTCQACK